MLALAIGIISGVIVVSIAGYALLKYTIHVIAKQLKKSF